MNVCQLLNGILHDAYILTICISVYIRIDRYNSIIFGGVYKRRVFRVYTEKSAHWPKYIDDVALDGLFRVL